MLCKWPNIDTLKHMLISFAELYHWWGETDADTSKQQCIRHYILYTPQLFKLKTIKSYSYGKCFVLKVIRAYRMKHLAHSINQIYKSVVWGYVKINKGKFQKILYSCHSPI